MLKELRLHVMEKYARLFARNEEKAEEYRQQRLSMEQERIAEHKKERKALREKLRKLDETLERTDDVLKKARKDHAQFKADTEKMKKDWNIE